MPEYAGFLWVRDMKPTGEIDDHHSAHSRDAHLRQEKRPESVPNAQSGIKITNEVDRILKLFKNAKTSMPT